MSNKIETSLINNLKEKEEIIIKKNEEIVKNIKETVDEELKIEWNRITNNTIL